MTRTVSAVVVTYGSRDVIADCLTALGEVDEVIVVDNASSDGSAAFVAGQFPAVRLIDNKTNKGFAAAGNQGVRSANNELILLINPDAVVQSGVPHLATRCTGETGAVGGKLVDDNGKPQKGFNVRAFPTPLSLVFEALLINRIWPSNPINRRYRCLDFDLEATGLCDQPAGAFLMFSKAAFEKVGGFDEQFFPLWFEDVDFCLRLKQAGFQIAYDPTASALHQGGHSLRRMALQNKQVAWYGSLLRFAKKHFSAAAAFQLRLAVRAGLFLRWFGCALGAGSSEQRQAYWKAWRMIAPRASENNRGQSVDSRRGAWVEQRNV